SCAASTCSCPVAPAGDTITTCSAGGVSTCTDTKDDPNNCGACGTSCGSAGTFVGGGRYCGGGGTCVCRPGYTTCTFAGGGGTVTECVDTSSDASACGSCTTRCGFGQVCSKGACVAAACPAGTMACPSHVGFGGVANSCVNTNTDYFNCGACGNVCGINRVCVAGTCRGYQPALGCTTCRGVLFFVLLRPRRRNAHMLPRHDRHEGVDVRGGRRLPVSALHP